MKRIKEALAAQGIECGIARGFSITFVGVTHRGLRYQIQGVGVGFDLAPFFVLHDGKRKPASLFNEDSLSKALGRITAGAFLQ